MLLEVIAISVKDVKEAVICGADRIELVTGIAEGGLTPSPGLIEAAVQATDKPVNVMLRPHSQSFRYSPEDVAVIRRDLAFIRDAGAAGVVFGALAENGKPDLELLKLVTEEAGPLDITFHRAFDECADQLSALAQLSKIPSVRRVLTSGGPLPAPQAIPQIRALVEHGGKNGIGILGGHGLTPAALAGFVTGTGVREVHFGSAVRFGGSFMHGIDPDRMAQVRDILDAHARTRD